MPDIPSPSTSCAQPNKPKKKKSEQQTKHLLCILPQPLAHTNTTRQPWIQTPRRLAMSTASRYSKEGKQWPHTLYSLLHSTPSLHSFTNQTNRIIWKRNHSIPSWNRDSTLASRCSGLCWMKSPTMSMARRSTTTTTIARLPPRLPHHQSSQMPPT